MIYLVTGLPRSGTSMLCKCLEVGGMNVVKAPWLDNALSSRQSAEYVPHPSGVYELPFEQEVAKADWPKMYDGSAIKVVFSWVHCLSVHQYRAVAILRDAGEVQSSFMAAFGHSIRLDDLNWLSDKALGILRDRPDVQLTTVNYRDVISNPRKSLTHALAGWPIDLDKAAAAVDPSLYRFRA